jgi:multimeric flavodoxin WrbA
MLFSSSNQTIDEVCPSLEIVVLNGARAKDSQVDVTSDILFNMLKGFASVSIYKLRDLKMADCVSCFGCWLKTPGICVINDDAIEIAQKMPLSDLIVYVTPIVFGGYPYELKKMLDRQISGILPFFKNVNGELHHPQRYEKRGKLAAIGVLPEPDPASEEIFSTLLYRNSLNKQATGYATTVVYGSDTQERVKAKIDLLLTQLEVKS